MITALISLFSSSIGKYLFMGLGIVALVGVAFGYVKMKESEAASAAEAAYNQVQLQVALKQNQEYTAEIQSLQAFAATQTTQISTLNGTIESLTTAAQKVITNEAKTDKNPLDPIFNDTLKQMQGGK